MSLLKKICDLVKGTKKHPIRNYAHYNAQIKGKVRDLFTCQFCGSREKVEGHHIKFFSKGGDAHKDNIITLCRPCHLDVHRNKKRVSKF